LDFVVEDLPQSVARAHAAGATVERDIQAHAWGRIALLADPFGNGFCLIQFTGRGYDEIAISAS
jgi:predicted enzyme related to lactoylglutathione lyase